MNLRRKQRWIINSKNHKAKDKQNSSSCCNINSSITRYNINLGYNLLQVSQQVSRCFLHSFLEFNPFVWASSISWHRPALASSHLFRASQVLQHVLVVSGQFWQSVSVTLLQVCCLPVQSVKRDFVSFWQHTAKTNWQVRMWVQKYKS